MEACIYAVTTGKWGITSKISKLSFGGFCTNTNGGGIDGFNSANVLEEVSWLTVEEVLLLAASALEDGALRRAFR